MKNKFLVSVAVCFSLIAGLVVGHAAWPDPEFDAGVLRIMLSGALAGRIESKTVASASAITINGNGSGVINDVVIQPLNKGIQFSAMTNAQLSTLAPAASGYLVINITRAALCISSGTGTGAWVIPSTGTQSGVNNAVLSSCVL